MIQFGQTAFALEHFGSLLPITGQISLAVALRIFSGLTLRLIASVNSYQSQNERDQHYCEVQDNLYFRHINSLIMRT